MPAYAIVSNYAGKVMNHIEYPKQCRRRSDAELRFTITGCQTAPRAMPDNPNAGYYQDEICYCADELARRARGGKRQRPTVDDIAAAAAAAAWSLCEGLDD
jgi:hypothetical protein